MVIMRHADHIPRSKKTLVERGLPHDSFFEVEFRDGSKISEHDANWSSISKLKTVERLGQPFSAFVAAAPIKSIRMSHGHLSSGEIQVPAGCEVYQAAISSVSFRPHGRTHAVLGRIVGLIRDGKVVQEWHLDAAGAEVKGFKI
jgi:hypothetical protein